MLQAEKRLDRSQNHKLCTHQGPLEITWNLLCCDFLLTAIYSHEEAACITISSRHPTSPLSQKLLTNVSNEPFIFLISTANINIDINYLYIHSIYRSQIMPQVPQSYQLPACLMQLTGLRFRQGQQIAWHLVQRLKEIRELVSKQFNQSMTTLWWIAVWQATENPLAPGTSTCDSAPPILRQRRLYQLRASWKNRTWNHYSRILSKRYQLTTPFIGSGWLWSRSNWTFILLALGVFVPRVEAGETILRPQIRPVTFHDPWKWQWKAMNTFPALCLLDFVFAGWQPHEWSMADCVKLKKTRLKHWHFLPPKNTRNKCIEIGLHRKTTLKKLLP